MSTYIYIPTKVLHKSLYIHWSQKYVHKSHISLVFPYCKYFYIYTSLLQIYVLYIRVRQFCSRPLMVAKLKKENVLHLMANGWTGIIVYKYLVRSSDSVAHKLMDFSHILWRRYKSKSLHCPKTKFNPNRIGRFVNVRIYVFCTVHTLSWDIHMLHKKEC